MNISKNLSGRLFVIILSLGVVFSLNTFNAYASDEEGHTDHTDHTDSDHVSGESSNHTGGQGHNAGQGKGRGQGQHKGQGNRNGNCNGQVGAGQGNHGNHSGHTTSVPLDGGIFSIVLAGAGIAYFNSRRKKSLER